MGEVLPFEGLTTVEIPPAELLDKAKEWGMTKCLVIGVDVDGDLCFGGSFSDVPLINLLLDHAKLHILDVDGDAERIIGT